MIIISKVLNRILKKSILASTVAFPPSKWRTSMIFASNSLEIRRLPDSILEIKLRSISSLTANSFCFKPNSFLNLFKSTPLTVLNPTSKNVTRFLKKCDKNQNAQSLVGQGLNVTLYSGN